MFEKLRKKRLEKDIKVKDICEALNLKTESAYYKKETGNVPFTLEEGKIIANLLSEPIESIFFDDELSCKDIYDNLCKNTTTVKWGEEDGRKNNTYGRNEKAK